MNVISIVEALAVIAFVVARRMKGRPVPAPKKLFLLPIVAGIIGLQNMFHVKMNATDITVVAIGAALSLSLGMLRGRLDTITDVSGTPWVSWSVASVIVFAGNVLAKVILDVGGVAAGGTRSALTSSIVLSLGLTLLGEAAVIWMRTQSLTTRGASTSGQYRGPVQSSDRPAQWPPIR
ncbi:MAG TPA: hypothetical protein VHV57_15255 [Acidimicrobiales bacterium]|jgi:hypothetical protein|nr:hypothetical protein [Acidimicrobiales bacterium]